MAQIFYSSRELLANGSSGDPRPPAPSPSPDVTPSPSPSPSPDAPKIEITDEVRDKLKPNQDPEKILDYVLNGKNDDPTFSYDGTTAKWDPTLLDSSDCAIVPAGSWETAKEEDGYSVLLYHPADKPDSQKMQEIKAALNLTRPVSRTPMRKKIRSTAAW